MSCQRGIKVWIVQRRVGGRYHTRQSVELRAVHHHDVQDGIHALGILAGTRVGDDLYSSDHRGGHSLQHLLGILRQIGVVVAVLIDFEVAVALHEDVVLTVHRHHRHFAQHVEHGLCLRFVISLHIVADAVYLLLDELALGFDFHTFQFLAPRDGIALHTGRIALGLGLVLGREGPAFYCQ